MATKLRRCLYIGLGGTGMNSLLHTKKMFTETYGEVPPMIGFLGIDTDGGVYNKTVESKYGPIKLDANEQMPIQVADARPIYEHNKEHFAWLPEENLRSLTSMVLGAGQVRSNGRFAFTIGFQEVMTSVQNAIYRITNASIAANKNYQLIGSNVEIHLVFSICGGTGCGTFLNMAYLLKHVAPQCKLLAYAVLPDVFEAMLSSGMEKVKANAYGAIQDLDWLMHRTIGSEKLTLDYIVSQHEIAERPFNSVMFIDNRNENGDAYNKVEDLCEMISLALVTSAGELSTAAASVSDNLEKVIREGTMDVEDKQAWAAGLGVCEILFRGKDLSEIYAFKASRRLIELIHNSCLDTTNIVNNWIDKPEVHIRENNNRDDVIDFMLKKNSPTPLSVINDNQNAEAEVNGYLQNSAMPKAGKTEENIKALTERVNAEFDKLLLETLNRGECGVGAAKEVIGGIMAQIIIFKGEMESELEEQQNKLPKTETAIKIACKDLADYDKKFFKVRRVLEEKAMTVVAMANEKATCMREILRRQSALQFYTAFQNTLETGFKKVQDIEKMLLLINQEMGEKLAVIANNVNRASQTFQIDLAQELVSTISVNDADISVNEFLKTLTGNKIYDFDTMEKNAVIDAFVKYTQSVPVAVKYAKRTIDDVLNEMPEERLNYVMDLALRKAMPLFTYNYRGRIPGAQPSRIYYVGVADRKNSRLCQNDLLKSRMPGITNMDFASIGDPSRVIIYSQVGVVPAYAIAPVLEYRDKYNRCTANCHFDATILSRMEREEYQLEPRQKNDDALEIWVNGIVFGLIKNEDKMYYYQDKTNGDPLDDYWMPLSQYRDEAFNKFRMVKRSVEKDYAEYIDNYQKTKGEDFMQQMLADVKINYLAKYSQVNMDTKEIKSHGNEGVASLIRQELEYIRKELC